MRGQRGTLRALAGYVDAIKVIFRDADVHGNVFPALEKSLDRASVTFVLFFRLLVLLNIQHIFPSGIYRRLDFDIDIGKNSFACIESTPQRLLRTLVL